VMFNADVIREVGLPIAEYFIWTDDYEFTGRISKRHRCFMVPTSRVTHAMKSNERPSLATIEESGIKRFYYLSRNDMHCYRQHGLMGHAYLAVKYAYTMADVLIHAKKGKMSRLATITKGSIDGIGFSPRIPVVGGYASDHLSPPDSRSSQSPRAKLAIISTQTIKTDMAHVGPIATNMRTALTMTN